MTKASASVGRAAILAASALTRHTGTLHEPCSPLTRQRAHDHTRVSGNTTRAQPCSGKGASLGARAHSAPCLGAPLCSPRSAHRSNASNAAGPAVAAYGCQRRTDAARAGIAARGGRPHLAPRSARRSEALTSLRAPRVARALKTQSGRQWQRTAGSLRRTRVQRSPHAHSSPSVSGRLGQAQ